MRYEDSMKGVAAQIIKEQLRASKIKNNPEDFHWHDEYATLNFFRFVCKNIGNLGKMCIRDSCYGKYGGYRRRKRFG